MAHDFRQRLRSGERLIGTMVTLPTPSTSEILAEVGYQWLFVDAEHGPLETAELLGILQAVSDRVPCVIRVPKNDDGLIKKALDLGAAGIIVPNVNSAEEAAAVVDAARYAPEGSRGVGLARAHGYGLSFAEYVENANDQIAVIVQAEHKDAVENIEAIASVPGVDAVLLGPYDLSASLGKMGEINDPVVTGAIDKITEACKAVSMPLGYFGVTPESIKPYAEQGYTLLVAGVDVIFLSAEARRFKKALEEN